MFVKKWILTAAMAAGMATGASAATVDVQYNIITQPSAPDTSPIDLSGYFGGSGFSFGLVKSVKVLNDTVQSPEFSVFDEDSGFTNNFVFAINGVAVISVGEGGTFEGITFDDSDTKDLTAGLYTGDDMKFLTDGSDGVDAPLNSPGFGIFYSNDPNNHDVLLAFSDRDASVDSDYNDLLIATKGVTAVPLPAAGLLLLTSLGGIAALRRRRKAATA